MARYDLGEIEISLDDPNSIDAAIMKITMIKRGLTKAMNALHDYLLDQGVEIAKANLVRMTAHDSLDGPLYQSIKPIAFMYDEKEGKGVGYISAGVGMQPDKYGYTYAVYVEGGTGAKRAEAEKKASASPFAIPLKLPAKQNKEASKANEKTWVYYDEKLERFVTTRGQPPKPFMRDAMYELWSRAQRKSAQLIKENLPYEEIC